ncbi:hypothetical protein BOTBODRAFT_111828 [Botryobasidium botryosum FD-172 SS1]|uniref:DNA-directed RNA polymerase III subunit RPC3 n=1 Tax=Botryobasidium botryosum (strain FD-172 SS1) TaxID=930990 RepID=A0A067MEP7_BOTB1|nr:hypothetical protein BOTBODRAFT_111828 [Botryobasidium botryosum FD-172 SS1]
MSNKDSARLCEEIIHEHFGPVTAKVASVLLHHGRLNFPLLLRLTGLRSRVASLAVLILVQHNLLWHFTSTDEGEMLELAWEEVLYRLRFGRYIDLAHKTLGEAAAEVVSLILDHGKLRLPDIIDHLASRDSKKQKLYKNAVFTLLDSRYLKPTTGRAHNSPCDFLIDFEEKEKAANKSVLSAKQLRELKERARIELGKLIEKEAQSGLKRKDDEAMNGKSKKRQKVDEDMINEEAYLRVNYSKYDILIRNQLIENAASQRHNHFAGIVLRATLLATLPKQLGMSDVRTDPATLNSIVQALPENTHLAGVSSAEKSSQAALTKEYVNILCSMDNPTSVGRESAFMSYIGGISSGKVSVELEIIGKRLKRRVLEGVVREKWGDEGVRIVRILIDKGKLSEDHVSKISMMHKKDVQPLLVALSAASIIAQQEVPRGTERTPSKTFYLWYIDLPQTYSVLLASFYKTLGNIIARRREEEGKVRVVLDKKERSEAAASANAEATLGRAEREALKEWEERKERLGVLQRRMEECVFVLKDMGAAE